MGARSAVNGFLVRLNFFCHYGSNLHLYLLMLDNVILIFGYVCFFVGRDLMGRGFPRPFESYMSRDM